MFLTKIGYTQTTTKDSVWLSILPVKTDPFFNKNTSEDYKLLYKKPVQLAVVETVLSTQKAVVLEPQLKQLLIQFGLNDSYSASDVKNTSLAKSLQDASYLSYPFASLLTANLANAIALKNNQPVIVAFENKIQQISMANTGVLSTSKMLAKIQNDTEITIDKNTYLRKRLLDFLIGNYNRKPENYNWLIQENKVIPYLSSYHNQYMKFGGPHQLLKKLIPAYKHFESYNERIKNLKNVNTHTLGFDVNLLSGVPYEKWEEEVTFIQESLSEVALQEIQSKLPLSNYKKSTNQLFENLLARIQNLDLIAKKYYDLVCENKIIYANNNNNKIKITRKKASTVVQIFDIETDTETPFETVEFFNKNTQQIWIYGLNGNDYFSATGTPNKGIPIAFIGGKGADKYVLEQGKGIHIYDEKANSYLIETARAKINLSTSDKFTKTDLNKYKHTTNNIKPLFGANPDDGIFIGLSDTYLIQNFNRNPFSQKHEVSAQLNLGQFGFNVNYYGEVATISNYFNAFVQLGYQSPNYATNFFGFGNESKNIDTNLKLDYNRVRMESITAKLGVSKSENKFIANAHLFFNSYEIEATEERFITSETLFFPTDDFFTRKNYMGLSLTYTQNDINIPFLPELQLKPTVLVKGTANISEFKSSFITISPNFDIQHPLYGDDITLDATVNYNSIIGKSIPFYLAANVGGNTGLRGYRNQRFMGQSSLYVSSNIKWKAKDLKSDVLPLQIGLFTGFDMGRVWVLEEDSAQLHHSLGGGVWLQSGNLLKAQLQVFGFQEGTRISLKLAMGL